MQYHYINQCCHMSVVASQITGTVCSTGCLGQHRRKHQNLCYWPFVRGIHSWPVNSLHKGPVMMRAFPCYAIIMVTGAINNIPTSVQIMAWCRPGNKPLFEPIMFRLPMHMCIIQSQRVKFSIQKSFIPVRIGCNKHFHMHFASHH